MFVILPRYLLAVLLLPTLCCDLSAQATPQTTPPQAGSGTAESWARPPLSLKQAAEIAERALETRGLAEKYIVTEVLLTDQFPGSAPLWFVKLSPVKLTSSDSTDLELKTVIAYLKIDMKGAVSFHEVHTSGAQRYPERPSLSFTKAADLAERQLASQGLAESHILGTISVEFGSKNAFYLARLAPLKSSTGASLEADPNVEQRELKIDLDGTISIREYIRDSAGKESFRSIPASQDGRRTVSFACLPQFLSRRR